MKAPVEGGFAGTAAYYDRYRLAYPDRLIARVAGLAGLKPGDRWCVCAARWLQVQQAGAACSIVLEATHENTLKIVPFELLIQYAVIPTQLN